MEPGMTSGPSPQLERAVLWLVPSSMREEVAGDLFERYRSPARYMIDIVRALPWVVWSQMRRGTDTTLFLLVAFTLVASLGGLEPGRGSGGIPIPLRALAAAVPSLVILLLRNAYRPDETWSPGRAAGDVAWLVSALLLPQAAFALSAPDWCLPLGWLIGGITFTATTMVLLRSGIELTNTGHRPGTASVADPVADFRLFHRNVRLRAFVEIGALAVPAVVAGWFALTAVRPLVSLIAAAWAMVSFLLVVQRWWHDGSQAAPDALPPRQSLTRYLAELERQRAAKGLAWWWYFAPLFAGIAFNTIAFGIVTQRPLTTLAGFAACLALMAMIAKLGARRRERLVDKIAQIKRSDEGGLHA